MIRVVANDPAEIEKALSAKTLLGPEWEKTLKEGADRYLLLGWSLA